MRGAAIARLLREDLVHGTAREPAAQSRIDRVMIEGCVIGRRGAFPTSLPARFATSLATNLPESLHRPPQHPSCPQLRKILRGGCGIVVAAMFRRSGGRGGVVTDHESTPQSMV